MNEKTRDNIKASLCLVILWVLFCVVGTMDYDDARRAETYQQGK